MQYSFRRWLSISVLVVACIAMIFGGWYVFLRNQKGAENTVSEQWLQDPFSKLAVPSNVDEATKQAYQYQFDGTKDMYEKKPDTVASWVAIGNLFRLFGQPQEAIVAYKKAIQIDPDNLLSYRNIAEVYSVDLRQYEDAATYYRLAIARNVSDPTLYLSYGFLLSKNLKQPQLAINAYLDGLKKTGNDRDILLQLIEMYRAYGPQDKEKEYADLLRKLYPNDPVVKAQAVDVMLK